MIPATARLALTLYAVSLVLGWHGRVRLSTRLTVAGFAVFLAQVYLAFESHHFRHAEAFEATRARTLADTGLDSGAGLWANHAFVAAWAVVVARALRSAGRPPLWLDYALHSFMGFMAFNGAVAFAPSPARYFGAATVVLLVAATVGVGLVRRRRAG